MNTNIWLFAGYTAMWGLFYFFALRIYQKIRLLQRELDDVKNQLNKS